MRNHPQFSQKDVEAVFHSEEAKKLLQILQKGGGAELSRATEALKNGDYNAAASLLKLLLQEPNSEALMNELQRKLGRDHR